MVTTMKEICPECRTMNGDEEGCSFCNFTGFVEEEIQDSFYDNLFDYEDFDERQERLELTSISEEENEYYDDPGDDYSPYVDDYFWFESRTQVDET
jgi:hypothetical protein